MLTLTHQSLKQQREAKADECRGQWTKTEQILSIRFGNLILT